MHGDAHHEPCDDRHEHQRERHPPIVIKARAVEKIPEKIAHEYGDGAGECSQQDARKERREQAETELRIGKLDLEGVDGDTERRHHADIGELMRDRTEEEHIGKEELLPKRSFSFPPLPCCRSICRGLFDYFGHTKKPPIEEVRKKGAWNSKRRSSGRAAAPQRQC